MKYNKIDSIEIYNFMSIKRAKLVFDKSGILNIKGYNDSGKSAILRALYICMTNDFKRNQVKFIKFGEDYFRIVISFKDGVSVLYEKYTNGQSLYEMYEGGKLVYTTKQGNALTRVNDVPEVIKKYMGMCISDSGACLNYQSRDRGFNKLFLIDTTGSENYQELHSILNVAEISKASNMINTDRNAMSNDIVRMRYDLQSSEFALKESMRVDTDIIGLLEEDDKRIKSTQKRKTELDRYMETVSKYFELPSIPHVDKIPQEKIDRFSSLKTLCGIVEELDDKKKVGMPVMRGIDVSRLTAVENLVSLVCKAQLDSPPKIGTISESRFCAIENIYNTVEKVYEFFMNIGKINRSIAQYSQQLDKIVNIAKKQGIVFKKCDNCGSYMEVNIGSGE